MSQETQKFQLGFSQFILLMLLQGLLLGAAFYWGTQIGRREASLLNARISAADQNQFVAAQSSPRTLQASKANSEADPQPTRLENAVEEAAPKELEATQTDDVVLKFKSSDEQGFSLQIASFPDEADALRLMEEWKAKAYTPFLSVESVPERGKWYRVRIGNFADEEAAKKEMDQIQQKENVTLQIVAN